MATLQAQHLTKSYCGRTVVKDVNLKVESGEVVGLLGPNGAGKTTTFYLLVGLTTPEFGNVDLNGEVITRIQCIFELEKVLAIFLKNRQFFVGSR